MEAHKQPNHIRDNDTAIANNGIQHHPRCGRHGHNHPPGHHHHHSATNNIKTAFFLNLFFAVVELVGGLLTNSVAILSDALHDLGDSISLAVAWRLQKRSERGRDACFSYGYKRFSLLGALVISVILLTGSFFVIYASIGRIIRPEESNAGGMVLLAVVGLVVNGAAAWRLAQGASLSERSVMLHLMEDVLGWAAVLVAAVVMLFVEVPILDPLLSLVITAWILYNVYRNLKATFRILLQGIPEGVDIGALSDEIRRLPGVQSLHDLHAWTLDGEHHVLTIHVVYARDDQSSLIEENELKQKIRRCCTTAGIGHVTVEIDHPNTSCGMENC